VRQKPVNLDLMIIDKESKFRKLVTKAYLFNKKHKILSGIKTKIE